MHDPLETMNNAFWSLQKELLPDCTEALTGLIKGTPEAIKPGVD